MGGAYRATKAPRVAPSAAHFTLRTVLLAAFALCNSALFFLFEQQDLHQRPSSATYLRFGLATEHVQLRLSAAHTPGVQPGPVPCPKGKYRPPNGGTSLGECRFCPRGVYGESPGLMSSDCTAKCPKGTYQDKLGAKSVLDCVACPAGVYGSSPGLTSRACTAPCPVGKYSLKTGLQSQSECDDCPPNYRGPQGRRGNEPNFRWEGGYPCDRYISGNTVLNGRDAAWAANKEAWYASVRTAHVDIVDNSPGPST